jgi:glycosyltransferase involved in cell wall biosynthesis
MTGTLQEAAGGTALDPIAVTQRAADPVVVYLTRNLVVGGAERTFLTYVKEARHVRPTVALLARYGGFTHELQPWTRCVDLSRGFPTYGHLANALDRLPGWTAVRLLHECRQLGNLLRETRAQVVSSFLMRAHLVALLTKRFLLPDVRVVLNIHEHWTDSAPFLYPRRRDQWLILRITRELFPSADLIVTVAQAVRDDLSRRYGVPHAQMRVVYNPLETARVRAAGREALSAAHGEFMSAPTIVAVGRLVRLKAFDLLIRALARVRQRSAVRLVLVGDGEERPALERLVRSLGLTHAVAFVGWQTNPWKFMARARVVALTSLTEAFPSVLSEALALDVPVLATRCSAGIDELLQEGACGLVVPPHDVAAIAAGLERLLYDERLRERLTSAGRRRVEDFALEPAIDRYEETLRGVAAAPVHTRERSDHRSRT